MPAPSPSRAGLWLGRQFSSGVILGLNIKFYDQPEPEIPREYELEHHEDESLSIDSAESADAIFRDDEMTASTEMIELPEENALNSRQPKTPYTRTSRAQDGSLTNHVILTTTAPEGLYGQNGPPFPRPEQIAVPPVALNDRRVVYKSQQRLLYVPSKRLAERNRRGRPSFHWIRLLTQMDHRTPKINRKTGTVTLQGNFDVLQSLYQRIINGQDRDVIPELPFSYRARGYIRLAGPEEVIEQLKIRHEAEHRHLGREGRLYRQTILHEKTTALALAIHRASTENNLKRVEYTTKARTAFQVPIPYHWTEQNLHDYILAITKTRESGSTSLPFENKFVVEDLLFKVCFHDPGSRTEISWRTLHLALAYLIDQSRLKAARKFMANMEFAGFPPSVETYNLLLRSCALDQNLNAFKVYWDKMNQENIKPNDQTWLALLIAVPTFRAKQIVARVMHRKGLHIAAMFSRSESAMYIRFSLHPFFDAGGSLSQYVNMLDRLLGTKWLGGESAGLLADELAGRGRLYEAVQVLNLVYYRHGRLPDKTAYHLLLSRCVDHRNVDFAMWVLIQAATKWNKIPTDHLTIKILFRLAMSSKSYNLLRVVWRYAAVEGELSHAMRSVVSKSLHLKLEETSDSLEDSRGLKWRATFGAVACGTDPAMEPDRTPEEIYTRERYQLWGTQFKHSFLTMLIEAWLLDREWAAKGMRKYGDLPWLLENAIPIPLVPRDKWRLQAWDEWADAGLSRPTGAGMADSIHSLRRKYAMEDELTSPTSPSGLQGHPSTWASRREELANEVAKLKADSEVGEEEADVEEDNLKIEKEDLTVDHAEPVIEAEEWEVAKGKF